MSKKKRPRYIFDEVIPEVGEFATTYGISFKNNPDSFTHSQNRPFLVIGKNNNGEYLGVKSTTQIGGYATEFELSTKKYPELNKKSVLDLRDVYLLKKSDFVHHGFLIDEKDYKNCISLMMKYYTLGMSKLKPDEALEVFKIYMQDKKIIPGTVIKTAYLNEYLLIINIDEENYYCLPLHRKPNNSANHKLQILKKSSYVDYKDIQKISKNDPIFIMQFGISPEKLSLINQQIELAKLKEKGFSKKLEDK